MGRRRARSWADRTLDLDVLLADDAIIDTPTLTVPHPEIARRPFVLGPLIEVWPDAHDPRTGVACADLPRPPGPRPSPVGVFRLDRRVIPRRLHPDPGRSAVGPVPSAGYEGRLIGGPP